MNLPEVFTLYGWEMRSALRDRTIVINSIVLPLVLYPVMLWLMFTGIAFVRGQTDDLVSRVALVDVPAGHEELRTALRADTRLQVSELRDHGTQRQATQAPGATAEELVRTGHLDAVAVFQPAPSEVPGNFRVRVVYDASRERSEIAHTRITEDIDTYRDQWLRREAMARGVDPTRWTGFAIERRNTATSRDMGQFLLGLMLPLFFVIMVALGCLNPAIDSTAGERERNTWETLITTAASRASIVIAKYLAVTTLGGLAGLLNVLAMMLTMRGIVAPLVASDGGAGEQFEFRIPLAAVPVMVVGAILLAGLLAAGMLLLASFARTFREGQTMVTPLYIAATLPAMFLGTPGIHLTMPLALIPVVNVALVVREAIGGTFKPPEMAVSALVTLIGMAAFLALARFVLAFENVLVGSYSGSLVSFLRERLRARSRERTV